MKIYYEDNHVIVVEKPVNMPTQEDSSQDLDLLSAVREYIRVTYDKPGNVYVGLIHRLDRPVGGIMVFAKTSKAASRLSEQVRNHTFQKEYTAVACGYVEKQTMSDWMVKNRKTNTSSVVSKNAKDAKYAELTVHQAYYNAEHHLTKIKLTLKTGRSHQIRVQLASRHTPLWGDNRYNPKAKAGQQIALWASSLSFDHPITKERHTYQCATPDNFPYNI